MVLFLISQPMKSVVRLAGSMSLNWPTTPMNNSVTGVPTRDSPGSTAAAALASGISPVSYTHLRAHETVLDLVCRLLLEKKKN